MRPVPPLRLVRADRPAGRRAAARSRSSRASPPRSGAQLEAKGHQLAKSPGGFGGYQAIRIDLERGVLIGGSDPRFLVAALGLPAGVPGKDVFRRVLMALQPAAFRKCFVGWLESLRAAAAEASGVEQPVLAVDGKTARRSHDRKNGLGTLHSVSIWASEYGLTLGQVACAEKSNEITAIPELLRLVDIKGAIITIDAMGAQKAIAEEIIGGKADYVLALKGNQETLHQAVIDHIDERLEGDDVGTAELVVREQGHGREEERTYLQLPVPEDLPGKSQWKDLKSIGVVTSRCLRDGQE